MSESNTTAGITKFPFNFGGVSLGETDCEKVGVLVDAGFFSFDFGQVEINIHNSQIQNVYLHRRTYKREA